MLRCRAARLARWSNTINNMISDPMAHKSTARKGKVETVSFALARRMEPRSDQLREKTPGFLCQAA